MVNDLALQVGEIDDIRINQAHRPHSGRGQIEGDRRAETPGADNQDFRLSDLFLPLAADFRENDVTAVANELFFFKGHLLFFSLFVHRYSLNVKTEPHHISFAFTNHEPHLTIPSQILKYFSMLM